MSKNQDQPKSKASLSELRPRPATKANVETNPVEVCAHIAALIKADKFDARSQTYVTAASRRFRSSAMVLLRVTDYRRRLMDAKRFQRGKAKKVRIRLTPPDEIAARKRSYRALERGYRRVTELDPKLAEAWCELASILDIRDRLDEAAKAARMAVRLDPAHDHIALLARIRAQQGFRSESQALARKVLRSKSAYARSAAADILRGEWDPRAFANPLEYRRMIRDITRAIRAKVRPIK